MEWNNLILVKLHYYFCTNGQNFNRNAKFTIIKIEKDIDMKSVIEKKEDKWIKV